MFHLVYGSFWIFMGLSPLLKNGKCVIDKRGRVRKLKRRGGENVEILKKKIKKYNMGMLYINIINKYKYSYAIEHNNNTTHTPTCFFLCRTEWTTNIDFFKVIIYVDCPLFFKENCSKDSKDEDFLNIILSSTQRTWIF